VVWRAEDPQGNEAGKVRWDIVPFTRGRGLDLGCGGHKAFPHFRGVDNLHHAYAYGQRFRPDIEVETCEKLTDFASDSQDFVFSSHLLEHIEDWRAALEEWWRVIRVGGHLVLYLPHKELYPNIGEPGANPDHKHDFLPQDIVDGMTAIAPDWTLLVRQTRDAGREYSFFQVWRKDADGCGQTDVSDLPKPEKTVCLVRYGGFGDMIQAASVLPGLKKQGYHVTVMTTDRGQEVLQNDPHIDGWIIQDKDQVPNHELGDYWAHCAASFDRFINLSASVEESLLSVPGKITHTWPKEARHMVMDVNYLEFTHAIAQVPFEPAARFYPTQAEYEWAIEQGIVMNDAFTVMVVLAGSSVHKAWPNLDYLIGRMMLETPECTIIMVGDPHCKILEAGFENEPRVWRRSGEWGIRHTMTAAANCDLVLGPETGVLNAVSFMPEVAKIVLLSHSSHENLTKGWPNTLSVTPDVPCHPCHMMHYDRQFCPELWVPLESHPVSKDEKLVELLTREGHIKDGMFATGAAKCAASISPDVVFGPVKELYESWRTTRGVAQAV